jgi:hypothetical protein
MCTKNEEKDWLQQHCFFFFFFLFRNVTSSYKDLSDKKEREPLMWE